MPIIALLAAININYKVTNVLLLNAHRDVSVVPSLYATIATPDITSIEIVAILALAIAPPALIRKDAWAVLPIL